MTNNQLNRERLEKIKSWRETYGSGSNVMLPAEEAEELARIALAAMDSDPVAEVVSIYGDTEAFGEREIRPLVGIQQMPYGTKLYRHAQPAVEDETKGERRRLALQFDSHRMQAICFLKQILKGSPDTEFSSAREFLKAAPLPGEEVLRKRMAGIAVSSQPAPVVLMVPDEMTPEQAHEIGYYYGDPVDVFVRGANWMRQHIIDSTLAAAPRSPGSEPATVPGKWIPLSEKMPPSRHEVLVGCWWGEKPRWCCKWATYIPGHPDAQSSGWLIPGGSWTPTHWMELPAGPKEVKKDE